MTLILKLRATDGGLGAGTAVSFRQKREMVVAPFWALWGEPEAVVA
jgi:hypothetical protein